MNRKYLRVAALAVFLYLSVVPTVLAAPRGDRERIAGPGDPIVRITKKIKTFFRGLTSQEDLPVPPRP